MRKTEYYFISTDHLTDCLWFQDNADFKIGMNYVAILAASLNVRVLSFILMSNHVHFVLAGERPDVVRFITEFKRRYSSYYRHKYGKREFLRRNDVDIKEIFPENEALERTIAYVQMNSVAANICAHASFYPWGTGRAFFNSNPRSGKPANEFSGNALMRLFHSKGSIPGHYMIFDSGYVDPMSYVPVRFVEQLFRTPTRMTYFLNSSSKARVRLEEKPTPSFRDQIILASIPDLCNSLFRTKDYQGLQEKQLSELVKQLRFRFSADIGQLARVLEFSYEEVSRLLNLID
jgi:REP element-mobilizing transposase RayT